jgi:hypothetical protein
MKRRIWRRVERTLCWYVFLILPDGDVSPIIGYWRRRDARDGAEQHTERRQLEVHRYGWKPT